MCKMKNKIYFSIMIIIMFLFASVLSAFGKPPQKSKFYDFSDQVIDGELKKPTALYTEGRKKVEFNRLLKLKRSFIPDLMETSKDKIFK